MKTQNNYICKEATIEEAIEKWDYEISIHQNNDDYIKIKNIFIEELNNKTRTSYIGILNNKTICDLTIINNEKGLKKEGNNNYNLINPNRVFMCAVRTNKEFENKGYFSKLLTFVEQDLIKKGYTEISIGVISTEEKNIEIYKHLGFTNYLGTEMREDQKKPFLYNYYYKKINTSN